MKQSKVNEKNSEKLVLETEAVSSEELVPDTEDVVSMSTLNRC